MKQLLKSRLARAVAIALALVGLYALLGFKLAPGIARNQAQSFVRENYGRELAIGSIAINPFKLQVEVRDLALPDADGSPMLGFERLFVDFELASLWNRAFTFREVMLEAPRAHAVVRPDGALNLADLALPDDPQEPDEPLPSVWIHQLDVERGALEFTDQARRTPFSRQFQDVGFALEDFRTTPEGGDFRFSARSRSDETFDWKGRFALEPVISSQGEFQIRALQAAGVAEFLGDALPFELTKGTIDLKGTYQLALGEQIELGLQLPSIELDNLGLRARGAAEDWVTIPSLAVAGTDVALAAQTVKVDKVTIDALTAQAWMSPDGSISIEQLFAPAPGDPAEPAAPDPGQPWTVTVAGIELTNASIAFEDRSLEPVKKFDFAPVNLRLSDASLDLARPVPLQLDATVNGHARFAASGTVTPEPLAADLDIELDKARMQILQPYVLPLADLTITGGERQRGASAGRAAVDGADDRFLQADHTQD